ncbi:MAG: hypothetical protein IAE78_03650 [Myxococcus sp.]|jgi:hypothetical protein|nr:hypothetical protein [Myxococcus sp.]MBM4780431.1 hypothetical protein [Archangiaceae bacterium]
MTTLLTALHLNDPASLKRGLTAALSALVLLAINPVLLKWHVPPVSDAVIASVAGVVAIFILQSGLKSSSIAVANLTGPAEPDARDTTPPGPTRAPELATPGRVTP